MIPRTRREKSQEEPYLAPSLSDDVPPKKRPVIEPPTPTPLDNKPYTAPSLSDVIKKRRQ